MLQKDESDERDDDNTSGKYEDKMYTLSIHKSYFDHYRIEHFATINS